MKNWKRYLAIAGIIVLVLVALLPFVFAFVPGEDGLAMFRAAIAAAFLLPVLLYAILLVARYYRDRRGKSRSGDQVDTIIFDMGKVLVDYDWETFLDGFHFPEEEREALAQAIFLSPDWVLQDRGCPDEEVLNRFIQAAPEYEKDIRRVFSRLEGTVKKTDYAQTWVKYLKSQGYHLYVLSNYGETLLKKTRHLMPLKEMDGAVFSCFVKAIKPEPEIYQYLLDTYPIDPEKAVFLDDREENLEAAEKFGIHTILFKDFKQAAAELEKMGVK